MARNPAYPPDYHPRPKAQKGQTQSYIAQHADAYFNVSHPNHASIVRQVERLAKAEAAPIVRPSINTQPSMSKEALRNFMLANTQALFDATHPDHQRVKAQSLELAKRVGGEP